jgi:plastocyanin
VFAHIPLWTVYPDWGWGTDDSEQALGLLKRFGSVSVLNGHIHQILQKVEGNVRFHTAMSTAFPQPAPGAAPSPGPMKVPAERLRKVLGITSLEFLRGHEALAVADSPLDNSPGGADTAAAAGSVAPRAVAATPPDSASSATTIKIDNFSFNPRSTTVPAGTTITWVNADDVPHKIVSSDGKFTASPALDTNDRYTFGFTRPGRYEYFCAIHPKMTGVIVVQ